MTGISFGGLSQLSRARKAVKIPFMIQNWASVYANVLSNRSLRMLMRRDGATFYSPASVGLWNHYNAIWENKEYTSRYDIPEGGVVVDVGANIGLFTILAARRARHVYAFEPYPESFVYLERNVRANRVTNVTCLKCGVSQREGTALMQIDAAASTSNTITVPAHESVDREAPLRDSVEVQVTTLPGIFKTYGLKSCDFLKMDCEGSEYEIIFQCPPAVLASIKTIALEYHDELTPYGHADLVSYLEGLGFDVAVTNVRGSYGILTAHRDFAAAPR